MFLCLRSNKKLSVQQFSITMQSINKTLKPTRKFRREEKKEINSVHAIEKMFLPEKQKNEIKFEFNFFIYHFKNLTEYFEFFSKTISGCHHEIFPRLFLKM